ncbi:MAG: RES family NAD+ phosphorylase [Aestuariivirga sp.]|uniref:RES family NAD+ phosphorylase n=1 Tax=Aestuariivirga sp. TaxID=2650926 RepID=UPI0025B8DD0D|nr:RES family NAD+ phosphorylase [Aestuariivirga sp.]MCA3561000.1 RES family NAD+ phosphorylase [Aestuariivirga sp.]
MPAELRKARDLQLLDAVDAFAREPFEGRVWRCVRDGRDPTVGSPSQSRWCNGQFDVLYTSLKKDGAIAEIDALLSLQPVFPSKIRWDCYELKVRSSKTLRIADLATLQRLGVETTTYRERHYERTQSIADAAFFLGFDALIVPSARWACHNLVLFTGRLQPADIELEGSIGGPIDWPEWRRHAARTSRTSLPHQSK